MRRSSLLIALLALLALARASAPAPWPPVFTNTGFTLPATPVACTSLYSWPQRALRIDHAAGAFECVSFYKTKGACSLLFNATHLHGLFDGRCCLDSPVGVLPPTWGDGSSFVQYELMDAQNTSRWQSPSPEHSFNVQADAPFLPARFGFPNSEQDIHFAADAFSFDPIPDSVFVVPADCATPCKAS